MSKASSRSTVEGHIAKRQRLVSSDVHRFEDFPREVRIRILQFATMEDLSNFAIVSRQSCEDCRDSSLSQSRVATVICGAESTITSVLQKLQSAETSDGGSFARCSHLKLVNHADLADGDMIAAWDITRRLQLSTKTNLDLSLPASVLHGPKEDRYVHQNFSNFLSQIMPNLREVDMSYVETTSRALSDFARNCPNLEKIHWNYCNASSSVCASGFNLQNCNNLKELYMENSLFFAINSHEHKFFEAPDDSNCVLQFCLKKLERVSLKDATYCVHGKPNQIKPFSQLGLMKFVRAAGNLRWFRSDLTVENVAILQTERPEITFVS